MKPLILASKSPRRKELLELVGINFDIDVCETDEIINENISLDEAIIDLAYQKAVPILAKNPDSIVLGADTIVVLDNKILVKPEDEADARQMLKSLSGKTHQVITGVVLLSTEKVVRFANITDVVMFEISDEEIDNYIKSKEPFDKAGAYAIQGEGAKFIKAIQGDYYTVVGLPIAEVYRHLKSDFSY